jgi:hypothetical protein
MMRSAVVFLALVLYVTPLSAESLTLEPVQISGWNMENRSDAPGPIGDDLAILRYLVDEIESDSRAWLLVPCPIRSPSLL